MPKVVSLTRKERFAVSGISLPAGWDFLFLTDFRENAIIDACRGADFGGLTIGALRRMQVAASENLDRVWRGEQP